MPDTRLPRLPFYLFLVVFITAATAKPVAAPQQKIKSIVIDAGHGGHDNGCKGSSTKEKEVTLAIALKLGALIKQKHSDIKIIYTRQKDEFVELHERSAIANRNHADVFISIHCNSGPTSVRGTETYAMGLHVTKANLEVAKRENSVVLMEEGYQQKYDGFDPNSAESHIIFSMFQNAYLSQSLALASGIEKQFKGSKRESRGVKQAGFLVLYRSNMPSVLVETGFLTHGADEKYLTSSAGQAAVAEDIATAFSVYRTQIQKTQ